MRARTICVLGGTGFVGRAIVERLVEPGRRIRIPSRVSARHREMLVLPGVVVLDGDVHEPEFLRGVFDGADVVINLIGILNERGDDGRGFNRVHAELPGKIAAACRAAGVARLLHMSALHASASAPSHYLRSKAAGEEAAHTAAPEVRVTSFRPSVIFGPGDSFTNRFAQLLRIAPGVFPLACPDARFQPVYVQDVASVFVSAIGAYRTFGKRYDLCGPTAYRLRDIVAYLARLQRRRVYIFGLNDRLSRLQAAVFEHVPGKPFSRDNYRSLSVDATCRSDTLRSVFGIDPTPLERIVPEYLSR
ncbi:MAG: complex I NDUFA9 subunit family protein [Sulfurifustis sp.]